VVHSRDHEEVGMVYEIIQLKTVSQMTIGKVELGFEINPKYFQKVAMEFLKNYLTLFSIDCLPACLPFICVP